MGLADPAQAEQHYVLGTLDERQMAKLAQGGLALGESIGIAYREERGSQSITDQTQHEIRRLMPWPKNVKHLCNANRQNSAQHRYRPGL